MKLLTFIVWDVQHGSASCIKTPNGKYIVVDLGIVSQKDANEQFSPLLHLRDNYGIKKLNGVIITHPHRDHIDDIDNFLKLSPQVLIRPKHLTEEDIRKGNQSSDKDIIDKYFEINSRYNYEVNQAEDPFESGNNGGVEIQSFSPTRCSRSELNNHSIVTILTYAEIKILVPGDNEPSSWNELLEKPDFLTAIKGTDILVAPHHGRKSAFSDALFEHISPKLTLISDGPESNTSDTGRYGSRSSGWTVYDKDRRGEKRKCLTTRNDGVITVKCWIGRDNKPYLDVTKGS